MSDNHKRMVRERAFIKFAYEQENGLVDLEIVTPDSLIEIPLDQAKALIEGKAVIVPIEPTDEEVITGALFLKAKLKELMGGKPLHGHESDWWAKNCGAINLEELYKDARSTMMNQEGE